MIRKVHARVHKIGFHHAWDGVRYAFYTQPNFQIHTAISLLVLVAMVVFDVSRPEQIVLIFAIILGLVVELINTAVESIVDLVTEEWRQSAKIAKDVAAGAMLVTAFGMSGVGLMIFAPYVAAALR